jgi:hypothetical protein
MRTNAHRPIVPLVDDRGTLAFGVDARERARAAEAPASDDMRSPAPTPNSCRLSEGASVSAHQTGARRCGASPEWQGKLMTESCPLQFECTPDCPPVSESFVKAARQANLLRPPDPLDGCRVPREAAVEDRLRLCASCASRPQQARDRPALRRSHLGQSERGHCDAVCLAGSRGMRPRTSAQVLARCGTDVVCGVETRIRVGGVRRASAVVVTPSVRQGWPDEERETSGS